ncbi:MAG: DUF1700 domain-containing protein [Lachnospiraceae bacterium]|nr:DUF1700 domain-containing protein [Lachnospiraceae bacterium]
MSKNEFMKELKVLLDELPAEEKEEALRYYDSYFEEAGADQEQIVIDELGSPGRIAAQILRDYQAEKTAGVYTEHGYQEQETERQTPVRYASGEEKQEEQQKTESGASGVYVKKKGLSGGMLAIAIIVAILTFPIWIGVLGTAFGIIMGLFGTVIGLVAGFGAGGIFCILGGVALFVIGIMEMFTMPVIGAAFVAAGLLLFGFGCLMIAAVGGIIRLAVWIVNGIVKWLNRLFHGRKGASV